MTESKEKTKSGKSTQKYKKYQISGETFTRSGRVCPKCGPGVFMGEHKDRFACGKCGFMERKAKV